MKTAYLTGPRKIEIKETERFTGELGEHEVLIDMKATTICASDTKHYKRKETYDGRPYPFILGHEPSGIVTKTGKKVTKVRAGDRVTIEPQNSCGTCFNCRRGLYNLCLHPQFMASKGFRGSLMEEILWYEDLVWKIPDNMPYEVAAMFEPMSVAYSAIRPICFSRTEKVAIAGAGAIGALARMIFHMIDPSIACYMIDISEEKLALNRKIGIRNTEYVNRSDLHMLPALDAVIDTTGRGSLIGMLVEKLNGGGYIGCIGFTDTPDPIVVKPFDLLSKEITIHGSARFTDTFAPLLAMVGDREEYIQALSRIVTHRFPLEEANAAFRKAAFTEDYLKIAIV